MHDDLETGAMSIEPMPDLPDSNQEWLQKRNEANGPKVQRWSEFVTENIDFIRVDEVRNMLLTFSAPLSVLKAFLTIFQAHRTLRHRTSSERIFTNKTAMTFALVSLWDRIFNSVAHEIPKLRPLDEVVDNAEDLRLFYVTEKEMIDIVDKLEIKYRSALEDKTVAVGPCDDVCDSLFRIFEKRVCENLLNLKTMMEEYCERTIIIRTLSDVRTETNEKSCCFAGDILEALDILMMEVDEDIEERHWCEF